MVKSLDRATLKAELWEALTALGTSAALLPAAEPALKAPIDAHLQTLIHHNPTPQPLAAPGRSGLLGSWQLRYASQGTVVTRRLGPSQNSQGIPAVTLVKIWQVLTEDADGTVRAENGARLRLPLLGEGQLRAAGTWAIAANGTEAQVSFGALGLRSTQFLGQSGWQLPELWVPVLPLLRRSALWRLVYVDEDTYIGEGATGNRFLFRRI
ncbi:PAP fibrillin [Prochlorothrix hollandica]|uniref:PAP fibrillin n=1 Tax=Prochlorothrix hollandica TaxID=1223 RepID=UPI0033419F6A